MSIHTLSIRFFLEQLTPGFYHGENWQEKRQTAGVCLRSFDIVVRGFCEEGLLICFGVLGVLGTHPMD
jgi:hypothetical protein